MGSWFSSTEYIYTGELGGFPENVGSPEWQEWIALRGNVSGGDTIAGINVVNDWQLDKVELDQRTSSLRTCFAASTGRSKISMLLPTS